VTAIAPQIDS